MQDVKILPQDQPVHGINETTSDSHAPEPGNIRRPASFATNRKTRRAKRAELAEELTTERFNGSQELLTITSEDEGVGFDLEIKIEKPVEKSDKQRSNSRERGKRSSSKDRGRKGGMKRSSSNDALRQVRERSRDRKPRRKSNENEADPGNRGHVEGDKDAITTNLGIIDSKTSKRGLRTSRHSNGSLATSRHSNDGSLATSRHSAASSKTSLRELPVPPGTKAEIQQSSAHSIGRQTRGKSRDAMRRTRGSSKSGDRGQRGTSSDRRRARRDDSSKTTISDNIEGSAGDQPVVSVSEKAAGGELVEEKSSAATNEDAAAVRRRARRAKSRDRLPSSDRPSESSGPESKDVEEASKATCALSSDAKTSNDESTEEKRRARRRSRDGRAPKSGEDKPRSTSKDPKRRSSSREAKRRSSSKDTTRRSSSRDGRRRGAHRGSSKDRISSKTIEDPNAATGDPSRKVMKKGGRDLMISQHSTTKENSSDEGKLDGAVERKEAIPQLGEQIQKVHVKMVDNEVPDSPQTTKKEQNSSSETVIEINPAFALLNHMGIDKNDDNPEAALSDPYVKLLQSCIQDTGAMNIPADDLVSPKTDLPDSGNDRISKPQTALSAGSEDSDIDSVASRETSMGKLTLPQNVSAEVDSRDDKGNEQNGREKITENPALVLDGQPETNNGKATGSIPEIKDGSLGAAVASKIQSNVLTEPGASAGGAADLLKFLGASYDDLLDMNKESTVSDAFALLASDKVESSVDYYKGVTTSTANKSIDQTLEKQLENVPEMYNDSDGENGAKKLSPPSIAPAAMGGAEKQAARRARRLARQQKLKDKAPSKDPSRVPEPSLAGDMEKRARKDRKTKGKDRDRGVTRSKSDEGPSLDPLAHDQNVPKRALSFRRPSLAREGSDDDVPRKVTRKEVRKASKFASLDEDDDDDSIEIVIESSKSEPKVDRRGMISKARSATNLLGQVTKRVAKKAAASSRNLLK